MSEEKELLEEKEFSKTLIQIGHLGAFYGMHPLALSIFNFYQMADRDAASKTAALIGRVLVLISKAQYDEAAELMEKFIAQSQQDKQSVASEVKVFLALVYKQAKRRADRVKALLEEVFDSSKGTNNAAYFAAQRLLAE